MALVEAEELISFCGATTDDSTLFESLAEAVTFMIENYCGRGGFRGIKDGDADETRLPGFEECTAEEYYSGDGETWIIVKRRPITAITHIKEEDPAGTWTEIDSSYYQAVGDDAGAGIIRYIPDYGETFTKGTNIYKIKYTAGYSSGDIPPDLSMAAMIWVKAIWERKKSNLTVSSLSLGPQSASKTFSVASLPKDAKALLDPYKPVGLM